MIFANLTWISLHSNKAEQKIYQKVWFDVWEVDGVRDDFEVPLDEVATLAGQWAVSGHQSKLEPEETNMKRGLKMLWNDTNESSYFMKWIMNNQEVWSSKTGFVHWAMNSQA